MGLLAEGRPIRKDTYHMAVAYLEGLPPII